MKNLIMGVDPGFSGAVAFYNVETKNLDSVYDMPIIKRPGKKTKINTNELAKVIRENAPRTIGAIVEDVHAVKQQGVVSTFTFGESFGLVLGMIAANFISYQKIRPAVWKTLLNLSHDKKLSIRLATQEFSDFQEKFNSKDGRAEAALLAKFGERIFKMENDILSDDI